jgi:ATP-dependent DNA helicase RecG
MIENQNIEWKASWRDEYLKWICGFANAQGGVLEIGKNDRGEVVSLSHAAKLLEDLPNKIRDLLGIIVDVDLQDEANKEFIRITVEPYPYPISYEGIYRVENYPIPENALREAVLNAIVHKDYSSSVPIQISVYDDRVMIWNNGRLPGDWTIDRLLGQHPSIPFNPDIANAFFRAGSIEAWGQGIERILAECKAMGTPVPTFRYETIGLWVEFPYLMPERADQKTSEKTSEKMLSMMKQDPDITISVIAEALGKSTRAIEMQLAKLKALGKIERIGPDKGGRWHVVGEDTG